MYSFSTVYRIVLLNTVVKLSLERMRNSWILQVLVEKVIGRAVKIYCAYNILLLLEVPNTDNENPPWGLFCGSVPCVSGSTRHWLLGIILTTVYYLNQSMVSNLLNIKDLFPYLLSPRILCLNKYFLQQWELIRFLKFWKLISDPHYYRHTPLKTDSRTRTSYFGFYYWFQNWIL